MKLFHWKGTECNRLYSHGDIIVMAENLEQARTAAMTHARARADYIGYADMEWLRQSREPDWFDSDAEQYRSTVLAVWSDLQEPPIVHDIQAAIFINGGE